MLSGIEGVVVSKENMKVAIDVGGLIFDVNVSLNTYSRIPDKGVRCKLYTELVATESGIRLYGFLSESEKVLFNELRKIPKIGPKMALSVLSAMDVDEFYEAVSKRDEDLISSIPGIGKKTALAIIVEFSGKTPFLVNDTASEAITALVNLGIKKAEALKAVKSIVKENSNLSIEELIKEALRISFKRHGR